MFRSVCPTCTELSTFDDAQDGREVECPRCRTAFTARPERPRLDDDPDRPKRADGSGYATLSLIIGLVALPSSCCGVGAILGLGGLLTGYSGLHSRLRSLSILGMMLNLAAIIFAIGAIIVILVSITAVHEVPPAPDGTQAPFVNAKK